MFDNPDFEGGPNIFFGVSVVWAYNGLFEYSKVLGLTWINTSTSFRGSYRSASLNPDLFVFFMMLIFLIPGLYLSIKRCYLRVKNGKTTPKAAVVAYLKSLSIYGIGLLLMIIFVPIITPYLRGWKSIF